MKIKNLKIGTQLKLGYGILILFVLIIGLVSYQQTNKIQQQTELIYEHPMQVRQAIGTIESDIHEIQIEYRNMLLAVNERAYSVALQRSEVFRAEVVRQFDVLSELYLGPAADVKSAKNAFIQWVSLEKSILIQATPQKTEEVMSRLEVSGDIGAARELAFDKILTIDEFAKNKAQELYVTSQKIDSSLSNQLILLIAAIILLSFLINIVLLRNIRTPLNELTATTRRFHEGDLSARSSYQSRNEFGALSGSFNTLADSIQATTELNQKTTSLAEIMMSENDPAKFFRTALLALSAHTNSQMAAVYLLSDDKKHFKCFESVGMESKARQKFKAGSLEGEFGAVLAAKKIVHLTNIPDDTPFSFPVVTGEFRPREIVTIPVLDRDEVVAVISLASLQEYTSSSVQLIQEMWIMLMTRFVGVLLFKKITDFSLKLEKQNHELEQQAREMSLQADELKEFNIELELQKKQLDEANQLKSAFLSNMSHELRTPLNSVIALSGVLNRRLKNQIQEVEFSYLGIIEKNGKQLLALINDILDLSRIEAGKEEINWSQFTVQELVLNIFDTVRPLADEKGISLVSRIPDDLPAMVSDLKKCHHILQNIIGNAVKFTEKGQVELTAEHNNGKFYVGIKDSGIGIQEDQLPHIFDEFRQADGKTSRKFGGTGLGLAIAKKYTQMLGGSIEVRSQEGAGSTFVVMLPESPSNHQTISSSNYQPENKDPLYVTTETGLGKSLLLVEDSEPQIIQLSDILEEEGYSVQVARNGKQALEAIQLFIPDAMILDLMMPEVDGFEVLETIRKQKETSTLPVLILSAKHVTKHELNFLKGNNIHQLIQKGDVNREELLGHVRNMVHPKPMERADAKVRKPSVKPENGKHTILMIEDNLDNTVTVKALLDGKYEIVTATDGLTGLEKVNRLVPSLVLLDISLPGLDGFSVLKEIKKNEALQHIPVIALTARAMKGDREDLLAQGFDDYISKPIDHILFGKTILRWLNGDGEKQE